MGMGVVLEDAEVRGSRARLRLLNARINQCCAGLNHQMMVTV
jgi:hypothetical protein